MSKFNVNKLCAAGLRYLVADADGQVWAYEEMPVRTDEHWRLDDDFLYNIEEAIRDRYNPEKGLRRYWKLRKRWQNLGREFEMPVYDVPFKITWEDEPYDIIEHGLVKESDLKIWPDTWGADMGRCVECLVQNGYEVVGYDPKIDEDHAYLRKLIDGNEFHIELIAPHDGNNFCYGLRGEFYEDWNRWINAHYSAWFDSIEDFLENWNCFWVKERSMERLNPD